MILWWKRGSMGLATCLLLTLTLSLSWKPTQALWSFGKSDPAAKTDTNDAEGDTDLVSPIINREIQVSVQAPWPSSPYNVFCEAHVLLRSYPFLDVLATTAAASSWENDQILANYETATQAAIQIAKQAGISNPLLGFSLAMRAASPTCELHRGLAEDSLWQSHVHTTNDSPEAFVVINGQVYVNLDQLPENLPSLTEVDMQLLPKETPRPTNTFTGPGFVILYVNLGSPAFSKWYSALVTKDWPIVVRHLGATTTGQDNQNVGVTTTTPYTTLQGYGVRLDVRNVEYKVFDERKTDDEHVAALVNLSNWESTSTTLIPQFLAGVNVTALSDHLQPIDGHEGGSNSNINSSNPLLQMQQKLQADLWKVHESQMQHARIIPPGWQRRKLSLQAATVIANSNPDQLLVLQEISQNLPSVASTLVHVQVPEEITQVAKPLERALQAFIRQSGGGLFINGKPMVVERGSFNVYEMLARLAEEQEILSRLENSMRPHFPESKAQGALEIIQSAWSQGEAFFSKSGKNGENEVDGEDDGGSSGALNKYVRIDVQSNEKGAVLYINDIEKDSAYKQWPTRMDQALMAMQYGMPPSVRRNLFTTLVVEDSIAQLTQGGSVGKSLATQLLQGQYPSRLAVLLVDSQDIDTCAAWVRETLPEEGQPCPNNNGDSWLDRDFPLTLKELSTTQVTTRDIHRLYSYVASKFKFRREILQAYDQYMPPTLASQEPTNGEFLSLLDALTVHSEILVALQVQRNREPPVDLARALQDMDEGDSEVSYFRGVRFAVDKGLRPGMSFLNGRPLPGSMDDEEAGEQASNVFMEEQQAIFGMIAKREFTDNSPKNIYRKILSKKAKNVFPKVHPLFSSSASESYLDLNHGFGQNSLLIPTTAEGSPLAKEAVIVVDAILAIDTPTGVALAKKFMDMMDTFPTVVSDTSVSVAFRVLPSTQAAAASPLCAPFASAADIGREALVKALESGETPPGAGPCTTGLAYLNEKLPSSNFAVANGRVYNIDEMALDVMDLELLLNVHMDHSKAVTQSLREYVDESNPFECISRATAFLSAAKADSQGRGDVVETILSYERQLGIEQNPLRYVWNGDCEDDGLKMSVIAIVDPVTESAQRLSPLLQVIRDELQLPLTLILAPKMEVDSETKIPISSYYRFVADPHRFQGSDKAPAAHFDNLPLDHILTVRMDVPEPWDIQQTQAIQDTDNLRCSLQSGCSDDAASGKFPPNAALYEQRHLTTVEYALEHLLFFGQCYDAKSGPPNGLQLTLSKRSSDSITEMMGKSESAEVGPDGTVVPIEVGGRTVEAEHYSDTLVMKTVGYWQLRANPGVWDLNFLKNSRGAEIFDMMEGDVTRNGGVHIEGPNKNNNTKMLIMGDFVTRSSILLVKRKPGYEKAELFSSTDVSTGDEDIVHVFSLATGHLYERLLKIMMLSVTKRTSTKVKFWLFENFLSPTFKASALAMAKRIGCEVEFVTYKWPEWLRGQTEKQRIIWGYKILFLDVLFPLNVKKIIYVDADQVVRGDLKILRDMDLNGAPYGYTPMCDSRESTIGYAFWKTGFWESHLRGKPYHISALYVVDLERFRQTLVGDQLRSIYQQLSADPGSLANLDQDLPNFAQHQVPIFSLPQEWLWCESWCSDETKPNAMTIDLCNNPLHKEPKLSMAKRIISGELFKESWEELDAEVESYEKEYFQTIETNSIGS